MTGSWLTGLVDVMIPVEVERRVSTGRMTLYEDGAEERRRQSVERSQRA